MSYARSYFPFHPSSAAGPPDDQSAPALSDVRLLGRQVVRRFVAQARAADQPTIRSLVVEHVGRSVDELPVVEENWAAYEHVNVQQALDVWLSRSSREHRIIGLADYRHRGDFGLADLLGSELSRHGPRPGNVTRVALPAGPSGRTHECLRAVIVLVEQGPDRIALLFRGPDRDGEHRQVSVEAVANRDGVAAEMTAALRELALELNVYRGQVVSFGQDTFGERASFLRFHERPEMSGDDLILPAETFADVQRQIVGVARHRDRLRSAGQHLKRGLLLYGPPGVGKTHTVRYLVGQLVDTTIIHLTGETLGAISEACSIARALQPSMIVVEDVDLIAQQRDHYGGETPLLFTLLNEMDGLAEDADVVFLLTTNRADLLEPALASRPGRVDQAVHIDLPDGPARRRLVELYRGRLDLDLSRLDAIVERTAGVTASFLKELLRRAAVQAAGREADADTEPLAVSADDLDTALDDLLDTRNQMTRAVLGFGRPDGRPHEDAADDEPDD